MADLHRFVHAQQDAYAEAVAELRAGRKTSHWMWFIFPQIAGLGRSDTARHYAITSIAEARDYLAHPLLGPRLVEASEAALSSGRSPEAVFGSLDALKLCSSLTLFEAAAENDGVTGGPTVFRIALDRLFAGRRDPETLRRLD